VTGFSMVPARSAGATTSVVSVAAGTGLLRAAVDLGSMVGPPPAPSAAATLGVVRRRV
jgi:hypothetical protein